MRKFNLKPLVVNTIFIIYGFSLLFLSLLLNPRVLSEEKNLFTQQVFIEAEGESFEGKVAVAFVVLNRVKSNRHPNTIIKVIKQPGQFCRPKYRIKKANRAKTQGNKAWKASLRAVNTAIETGDFTQGATFFWNPKTATSGWFKNAVETGVIVKTVEIGNHVFFKRGDK